MANNIYRVPTIYSDIKKTTEPLSVRVPGSKSITNRSLLLAMLAEGKSTLRGVLFSDDSRHFLKCVQDLGFETTVDEESYIVTVEGLGGKLPCEETTLNVGSAGTAARFLTATLGVSEGVFHMDSSEQMKRRPMDPLLSSLAELGCEVRCEGEDGHFPFTLTAHGFGQDHISIDIGHSSQFLSALLIASTLSSEDFMIQVEGTHGMAYIEMTQKMMEQFGVCVERPAADQFRICTGQKYRALDYQIEPDVSAACYFYAMTPLLGIPVCVEHVHFESLQGDVEFLHILEKWAVPHRRRKMGYSCCLPQGRRIPERRFLPSMASPWTCLPAPIRPSLWQLLRLLLTVPPVLQASVTSVSRKVTVSMPSARN